jgi:hypothetical protein
MLSGRVLVWRKKKHTMKPTMSKLPKSRPHHKYHKSDPYSYLFEPTNASMNSSSDGNQENQENQENEGGVSIFAVEFPDFDFQTISNYLCTELLLIYRGIKLSNLG